MQMKRRQFLSRSLIAGSLAATEFHQNVHAADAAVPPSLTVGEPLVAGPDSGNLAILQALSGPASGYIEISINRGEWQKVLPEKQGMVAFESHVLKFRLPPLPAGAELRYKVTVYSVQYASAYKIQRGPHATSVEYLIRCLDPTRKTTQFVVWNDTHENAKTIDALHQKTSALKPDFLLWNGDQTNDVYAVEKMANQYVCPAGLGIAAHYPLAYLRGNHDVRGPAARYVEDFTHCPGDDFSHAFRSGPVACLTMDTGEDKPDSHPVFQGMVHFDAMRARQTQWLAKVMEEPWFRSAPYKLLFCHIPLWWTVDDPNREYYNCHKPCRMAWQDLLRKGGIQMILSGHTHEPAYLPVTDQRPIAQMVGGGPQLERATIMHAVADERHLRITMSRLDGAVLHDVTIHPV
jgi:predicted phosphodiesterase